MIVPKGDGGKPIEYGDSSYISDGIYNPIVWVGKEAYRPRVETLVIRENNKVFLRLYDKKKNNSYYTLPGGSVDADSTKIQQAENETNEEALVTIKDIYYTGIQYYDRYAPGFIRNGSHSPIEYAGTINDVYVAKYSGIYDKSKVEPKDLDPDIADNGKFYHIPSILKYLRPEHVRALAECPFVDPLTKMRINLYMADNSAAITESLSPDFDTVLPPSGGYLYHGSRFKIDVFHPMSVDFGNAKQKPGWSTFCFADPTLALRFGLMRTIQNAIGDKYHCEWNFEKKKPFLYYHELNDVKPLIMGKKFYVHHIPTEGLDIGIGNDIRFPEYTFREDNVYPKFVTSYTIDDVILQAHVEFMGIIEYGDYEQRFLKTYDAFKDRHYAAFINRDYANDPIIKKVNDAISRKELQPGDDVEQFMIDHNLIPEDIVWNQITEAVTIKTALRPITKNNYERYKKENPKSMIRHMREPDDVNQGYFMVDQRDKLVGYVMVDTSRQLIIALEVIQAYRNLGMGEKLLDIARTKLNAKFLTVNKKNIPAIKLYEKHGWKTYKEDGTMYYMSAPGVTFTMEGYRIIGMGMSTMVPVTEKRLTAVDRKNIPSSDYGISSLRKYPMPDKKHVLSAIQYFNSVEPKYEKELARNILRKIDEYGMKDVVHVGKNNRFSKYVDKSMVQESYSRTTTSLKDELFRLVNATKKVETVLHPSVPDNFLTENGWEDNKTKRVCFSTSIDGCLRGLSQDLEGKRFCVLKPNPGYEIITPTVKQVPDVNITNERWITSDRVKCHVTGYIEVSNAKAGKGFPYTYGDNRTAYLYDWNWKWVGVGFSFNPDEWPNGSNIEVQEASTAFLFYHVLPKDYVGDKLMTLGYLYDTKRWDLFDKYSEKYRYRICNTWRYYDKKPEELTREEIVNALMRFRGTTNLYQAYFFKYPPTSELGARMGSILQNKDVYQIDLNDPNIRRYIKEIDWGHEGSNTDNTALNKTYYENVTKDEYFKNYNDAAEMNYAALNHISITFKNGFIPLRYLTKYNGVEGVQEVTYRTDDVVYQNFEKFESEECNYCFVTGLSGSGKSTLANKLCKDYDAIWIELDVFLYGDKVVDHKTSKVWSPEYPFVHFIQQNPKYRRLLKTTSEDVWSIALNVHEATREFIRFTIDWCKKRKNKRYVIEGVQIFIACDKDTLENEPIIIVDRSVATAYFQRARRDVGSGYVDILTELRYTPKLIQYYMEDIKDLRKFKRNVLEESILPMEESTYRDDDVIYQNFEKFQNGEYNHCLVTGLSGSGKSTLSDKLAEEYHAIHIELDFFAFGYGIWKNKGSKRYKVLWSKDYPYIHYMKTRPDLCKIIDDGTKQDWMNSVMYSEEENIKFISFIMDWCKGRPDKKYIIEGYQICAYCSAEMVDGVPLIIVDRSVATAYRQRVRREVTDFKTFWRELKRIPESFKMYQRDSASLNDFKDRVLEESFIDIDEIPPGKGEKSYGIPDGRSQGKDPYGYDSFVVSKYLHHGEYFGLTDWEKSISDYIEKKNYDKGLYYVYGNNNGYPEYLGPVIVYGNRQWSMYRDASPMAATESTVLEAFDDRSADYRALVALYNELVKWGHGYVYMGRVYTDVDSDPSFVKRYRTLSVSTFEKYHCGTCIDYCSYIYQKCYEMSTEDEEQFSCQLFYIEGLDMDLDMPCHTFPIVRLRNGKYYWVEASWKQVAGVYEYSTLKEALKDVKRRWLDWYQLKDYMVLCEWVPRRQLVGINCYRFMQIVGKNTNLKI